MKESIKVGIIGGTSFTGRELLGFLLSHPKVKVSWMTSHSQIGADYRTVYPEFKGRINDSLAKLKSLEEVKDQSVDAVFSCLPHGASAKFLLPFISQSDVKIIDLSADFRIKDQALYEGTYEVTHPAPESLKKAQYGLCELYPSEIKKAQVIGNPGCYPTSVLLPLIPLLKKGLIESTGIIVGSKSGVYGAGKKATEGTHYVNCNESVMAYKLGDQHRHLSEIREQLECVTDKKVDLLFTPHLMPMERGILSSIYCQVKSGVSIETVIDCLEEQYKEANFVQVVDDLPQTGHVRHTNHCHIYPYLVKDSNKLILISVIDNLIKGASGQAVQNMNLQFGFEQTLGLI